jgi:hypothetical protein
MLFGIQEYSSTNSNYCRIKRLACVGKKIFDGNDRQRIRALTVCPVAPLILFDEEWRGGAKLSWPCQPLHSTLLQKPSVMQAQNMYLTENSVIYIQ